MSTTIDRRILPVGAEAHRDGSTHFRVWAPRASTVEVALEGAASSVHPLMSEGAGYFSGLVEEAQPGTLYRYRLDGRNGCVPTRPRDFSRRVRKGLLVWWTQASFAGPTWAGAARRSRARSSTRCTSAPSPRKGPSRPPAASSEHWPPSVSPCWRSCPWRSFPGASAGATTASTSLRPRACTASRTTFGGSWTWRTPLGLGVILDVVYNHIGPDGNCLKQFSDAATSPTAIRPTGARPSTSTAMMRSRSVSSSSPMPGTGSTSSTWTGFGLTRPSRSSTRQRNTSWPRSRAVCERPHTAVGRSSSRENEPQDSRLVRAPSEGGFGLDALWNDDFHHSAGSP